jgi:hypothetical protein
MSTKLLLQFNHTIVITVKLLPQLDHRNCNDELFQLIIEKNR